MKTMGSGHGNNLGFNRILQSSPCLSRESHGKKHLSPQILPRLGLIFNQIFPQSQK